MCYHHVMENKEFNIFEVLSINPATGFKAADIIATLKRRRNQFATNPARRAEFDWLKKIIPQVETNPDALLSIHAAEYATFQKKRREASRQELIDEAAIYVVDGVIDRDNLDFLVSKYSVFSHDEILDTIGAHLPVKALDDAIMRTIASHLVVVGKKNLYEVLELDFTCGQDEIQPRLDCFYNKWSSRAISHEKEAMITLLGYCKTVLADASARACYDNALLEPMQLAVERLAGSSTRAITKRQMDALLRLCDNAGVPREVAIRQIIIVAARHQVAVENVSKPNSRSQTQSGLDDDSQRWQLSLNCQRLLSDFFFI